jgi:hypothetical protein
VSGTGLGLDSVACTTVLKALGAQVLAFQNPTYPLAEAYFGHQVACMSVPRHRHWGNTGRLIGLVLAASLFLVGFRAAQHFLAEGRYLSREYFSASSSWSLAAMALACHSDFRNEHRISVVLAQTSAPKRRQNMKRFLSRQHSAEEHCRREAEGE